MSGGKPIVRKVLVVGLSVWGLLACSLICAAIVFWNAEPDELEKKARVYWHDRTAESDDSLVMTLDEAGEPAVVSNIGRGYLIEGDAKEAIYYATADKDHAWSVHELFSGKEVHKLQSRNVLRVLAYYDSAVYYIEENAGHPRAVSEDQNGTVRLYPAAKYIETFSLDSDDDFPFGQNDGAEGLTIYRYTATVSPDGKIAYCHESGAPWDGDSYSQGIYLLTPDMGETYIGEGSNIKWIGDDVLIYQGKGSDLTLYQYNVETGETSCCLTSEGTGIAVDSIDPGSRFAVSGDESLYCIRGDKMGHAIYQLSLVSGEIRKIQGINPMKFMDAVWVAISE